MYPKNETDQSYSYLKKVVSVLDEPICIVGGWAIYFTVNRQYQDTIHQEYSGSNDIDLGFHFEDDTDIEKSAFSKAIKKLEEEGFEWVGGRMRKALDKNTGKELLEEEARTKPQYDITPMFVDFLVDCIPSKLQEKFKGGVLDESLLCYAFEDKTNVEEIEEFGRKLWLPKPWLLLATKIKALPGRPKNHKREKDLYDIAALLLFKQELRVEGNGAIRLLRVLRKEDVLKSLRSIADEEITQTEERLGVQPNSFRVQLAEFISQIERLDYIDQDKLQEWQEEIKEALEKENIEALTTILASIRNCGEQPLFYDKKFRDTIFSLLEQTYSPEVASELARIIYNQWRFRKELVEPSIIKHKGDFIHWFVSKTIRNSEITAMILSLLLAIGETAGIVAIVSTKEDDLAIKSITNPRFIEAKSCVKKEHVKNLRKIAFQKMNSSIDNKIRNNFQELYKVITP